MLILQIYRKYLNVYLHVSLLHLKTVRGRKLESVKFNIIEVQNCHDPISIFRFWKVAIRSRIKQYPFNIRSFEQIT